MGTLPRFVVLLAATHNLISTFQAIVLGVLQGATELFPVSSLGHTGPPRRPAGLAAGGCGGASLPRREGLTPEGARRLDTLEYREAGVIGVAQSSALIAGISRDGVVMTAGLARGLD